MTEPVSVSGRDSAAEAYRINTLGLTALVPECLMDSLRPGQRPTHQEAYEWIAANRARIVAAVAARRDGKQPKPPFDLIALVVE